MQAQHIFVPIMSTVSALDETLRTETTVSVLVAASVRIYAACCEGEGRGLDKARVQVLRKTVYGPPQSAERKRSEKAAKELLLDAVSGDKVLCEALRRCTSPALPSAIARSARRVVRDVEEGGITWRWQETLRACATFLRFLSRAIETAAAAAAPPAAAAGAGAGAPAHQQDARPPSILFPTLDLFCDMELARRLDAIADAAPRDSVPSGSMRAPPPEGHRRAKAPALMFSRFSKLKTMLRGKEKHRGKIETLAERLSSSMTKLAQRGTKTVGLALLSWWTRKNKRLEKYSDAPVLSRKGEANCDFFRSALRFAGQGHRMNREIPELERLYKRQGISNDGRVERVSGDGNCLQFEAIHLNQMTILRFSENKYHGSPQKRKLWLTAHFLRDLERHIFDKQADWKLLQRLRHRYKLAVEKIGELCRGINARVGLRKPDGSLPTPKAVDVEAELRKLLYGKSSKQDTLPGFVVDIIKKHRSWVFWATEVELDINALANEANAAAAADAAAGQAKAPKRHRGKGVQAREPNPPQSLRAAAKTANAILAGSAERERGKPRKPQEKPIMSQKKPRRPPKRHQKC